MPVERVKSRPQVEIRAAVEDADLIEREARTTAEPQIKAPRMQPSQPPARSRPSPPGSRREPRIAALPGEVCLALAAPAICSAVRRHHFAGGLQISNGAAEVAAYQGSGAESRGTESAIHLPGDQLAGRDGEGAPEPAERPAGRWFRSTGARRRPAGSSKLTPCPTFPLIWAQCPLRGTRWPSGGCRWRRQSQRRLRPVSAHPVSGAPAARTPVSRTASPPRDSRWPCSRRRSRGAPHADRRRSGSLDQDVLGPARRR